MEDREKQRLWKVNKCFLGFSADPDKNIQNLTSCCGDLMGAACALYNRIQDGMLCTLAQWNAPPGFNPVDRPDGHICHDVIKRGGRDVFLVRDLPRTRYAETDPNVSAYCLKTYIGVPVNCKHRCVGSLCVVYQEDYSPDEEEKKILQILAVALGVEEERRQEADALRNAKGELEIRVKERTAELARVNDQLRVDVAERERAEMDIRRMNEELTERTAQLLEAQEELVRKEKLAVLGRLAGVVGHELRNPLGVMNNAIYFLKTVMADAGDEVREYLDIIKQEIDHSQRIISDLLDFAFIRTPQPCVITAGELVTGGIRKCEIPESVHVQTDIPEMLPKVVADPKQMGQVLENLIINAVQAMPEGGSLRISAKEVSGCRLKVESSNREPGTRKSDVSDSNFQLETFNLKHDGDFVEISVTDTGEGISEQNMKKLFQPLFTTRSRGIGLGLVVSRNLTEANGGGISVESRPGKGATFSVLLPIAE